MWFIGVEVKQCYTPSYEKNPGSAPSLYGHLTILLLSYQCMFFRLQ